MKVDISMKQTEYAIITARGHVLIDGGEGLLLVDTGSPMSFHESGRLDLCGESLSVPTSLMGVGSDYVSDKVGERVTGLVGMDVIGRFGLLVDIPGERLVFGHPTDGMTRVPSRIGMGYASVEMELSGKTARVILDTGAPTSYVSPSFTDGLEPVDRVTDFNPMVPGDTFETPVFEFPASFAGHAFTMRAGHLPETMRMMLSMLGVDGVVGLEILSRVPVLVAEGGVWV